MQNWKKAKNSLIRQQANRIIENRYNAIASTFNRNQNNSAIVINLREEEKPVEKIGQQSETKKSAVEAAKIANTNIGMTCQQIVAMIPIYKAPLPRRSWIAKFRSLLSDPTDPRFIDLK